MRPRSVTLPLSITIAVACLLWVGVATAPPLIAQAGGPQPTLGPEPPRFSLHVLPSRAREWVVLDTQTGAVQHWVMRDSSFIVTSAQPRELRGGSWRRDVITGGRQ